MLRLRSLSIFLAGVLSLSVTGNVSAANYVSAGFTLLTEESDEISETDEVLEIDNDESATASTDASAEASNDAPSQASLEISEVTEVEEAEETTAATTSPRSIISFMEAVSDRLNQEEEVGVPPSVGDFTVVLGYSIPSENVQSFLDQLHAQGAKKAVLIDYKSQNVIVYGSYKTHEEANVALQELLANKNAASGWIMQMK